MDVTAAQRQKVRTGGFDSMKTINLIARLWSWLFLLVMLIFFSITGTGFFTVRNLGNIMVTSTMVMLMATGQTYVIITAGIDLSIGYTLGLASVISATVMRDLANAGLATDLSILLGILAGLTVTIIPGLMNGMLVARAKVPPMIATLGVMGIVRGAAFLLTTGKNVVGDLPPGVREHLRLIGNGSLAYRIPGEGLAWLKQPADLTNEQLRGLERLMPYPIIIVAVIVGIFAFVLARTTFGRHIYAIGGNREAALRSGINVTRTLIIIYVLAGFLAGCAGVLHVFRFTAGSPMVGDSEVLNSVAAVVIGGASLMGGSGKVIGTVIGSLIIAVLQTGLVILNVDSLWQFIVVGVIIIVAVLVNQVQAYFEKQQEHTA